jgi:hypothetical protein
MLTWRKCSDGATNEKMTTVSIIQTAKTTTMHPSSIAFYFPQCFGVKTIFHSNRTKETVECATISTSTHRMATNRPFDGWSPPNFGDDQATSYTIVIARLYLRISLLAEVVVPLPIVYLCRTFRSTKSHCLLNTYETLHVEVA